MKETSGYTALAEIGMRDFAFEAVVIRHPDSFSADAVARSRERLAECNGPDESLDGPASSRNPQPNG